MILFGITVEHCYSCHHPTPQIPFCDDCLTRWAADPEQNEGERP